MKATEIQFLKPAWKDLYFTIKINDDVIAAIEETLKKGEKYIKVHPITMYDKNGELCVEVRCEIYIRNLELTETKTAVSI